MDQDLRPCQPIGAAIGSVEDDDLLQHFGGLNLAPPLGVILQRCVRDGAVRERPRKKLKACSVTFQPILPKYDLRKSANR